MTLNLTDIEQKALAATPGPWRRDSMRGGSGGIFVLNQNDIIIADCAYKFNTEYIAATSPDVVLKMISIIRKQQEALGVLSDVYVCDCKEAIKIYRQSGPRAWCCECSNYIRNEDDATFYERVEKARQTLTEVNEVMG